MEHRIVVTRHRPWLKPLLIGGGSFVLALSAWGLYSFTRASTVSDFERSRLEVEQLRDERRTLTHQLREAREQIKDMKGKVVYEQRSQQIDSQACASVRDSLSKLQAEASDLREQLAFYRGIVAPEQSRAGVRVYEFKLTPGQESGHFHFELVLIQSVRHDKRIAGHVDLQLIGNRDGEEVHLPWEDLLTDDSARNLLFSLKYFEEFSGDIAVPQQVEPSRVVVTLVPDGAGKPHVEESFDWARVVSGGDE